MLVTGGNRRHSDVLLQEGSDLYLHHYHRDHVSTSIVLRHADRRGEGHSGTREEGRCQEGRGRKAGKVS